MNILLESAWFIRENYWGFTTKSLCYNNPLGSPFVTPLRPSGGHSRGKN